MTTFDSQKALFSKKFYRFTGPPENWLTAIKYMTWGLEDKYLSTWQRISPGDVFFMHSTVNSKFKNVQSSVIGIGVVGPGLRRKNDFLWLEEIEKQRNIWPLLVPFSEIYLFSDLPESEIWEAPGFEKSNTKIQQLVNSLLRKSVKISYIKEKQILGPGFPVMGTISSVSEGASKIILEKGLPDLYQEKPNLELEGVSTKLTEIRDAEESLRYIPTLKFLNKATEKKQSKKISIIEKDNTLLERADQSHFSILQDSIDYFRSQGFETYNNVHVDLFAKREDQSFLLEVKSTTNNNFKNQARKAISQLFEYEYFDIQDFLSGQNDKLLINKIIMLSDDPNDKIYTDFINHLKIFLGLIKNGNFVYIGKTI